MSQCDSNVYLNKVKALLLKFVISKQIIHESVVLQSVSICSSFTHNSTHT